MKNYLDKREIERVLRSYVSTKPFFLGLIRCKEAVLFQDLIRFARPVLDHGCGDGFFAQVAFSGHGEIDTGLDVERNVLLDAKRRKVYKKLRTFGGKKFPFRDRRFKTVVSNCVLEHVEHLDENLSEINRVLKKDGLFAVSVMTDKWDEYSLGSKIFGRKYREWFRRKQVHINLLTKKQWDEKFVKHG